MSEPTEPDAAAAGTVTGDETASPPDGIAGNEERTAADGGRWVAARRSFRRSLAYETGHELNAVDFVNQAILLGAGLLVSLVPLMILLGGFASQRVDDDLARHLGLDRRAASIVSHLFTSSPARLDLGTATSLVIMLAGTVAIATSLQQTYEKVFGQPHRGPRDLPRLLVWIAVLCGVIASESIVGRPARNAAGGSVLIEIVTFAVLTPFFWWTMHFLLGGRVRWPVLLPSAVATGVGFALLGVFSGIYFSPTIISDAKTYGPIGAVFGILTWLIAIGGVIILGAVAGSVWLARRHVSATG